MTMLIVVPAKELVTKDPGILDGAEPLRELRAVFQGLELGLGVGIVIAHMGSTVRFGHAQIGKEMGHRL